jgi:hypothetical protein
MGDAYVDILTLAYDGDIEKAWSMTPNEDYQIIELTYNTRRNKFGRETVSRGKPSPSFLFIRVKIGEKAGDDICYNIQRVTSGKITDLSP